MHTTHIHETQKCARALAQRNFIILCVVFVYRQIIPSILSAVLSQIFHLTPALCIALVLVAIAMSLFSISFCAYTHYVVGLCSTGAICRLGICASAIVCMYFFKI